MTILSEYLETYRHGDLAEDLDDGQLLDAQRRATSRMNVLNDLHDVTQPPYAAELEEINAFLLLVNELIHLRCLRHEPLPQA